MTPVLVAHADPDEARAELEPRFAAEQFVYVATPEALPGALARHRPEVVFTLKSAAMPGPALRAAVEAAGVRWVHVAGSGYDHLLPIERSDLVLTNAAGVLAPHLAETVTGAILALNGHFLRYVAQGAEQIWQPLPFRPLAGQTVLIAGLGHIGARVGANLRALGMQVLATRRHPGPEPAADEVHPPEALARLLPRADVVSVHVRLDAGTRHLFDAAAFARMRKGVLFVNTARGAVVDESALVAALDSGHVRGAYLDVFEREPLPAESPLWGRDNVLLTPHAADNIDGWHKVFLRHFAANLARWRSGETLENVIAVQP